MKNYDHIRIYYHHNYLLIYLLYPIIIYINTFLSPSLKLFLIYLSQELRKSSKKPLLVLFPFLL